jgi:hypothetical protein
MMGLTKAMSASGQLERAEGIWQKAFKDLNKRFLHRTMAWHSIAIFFQIMLNKLIEVQYKI